MGFELKRAGFCCVLTGEYMSPSPMLRHATLAQSMQDSCSSMIRESVLVDSPIPISRFTFKQDHC